MPWVGALLLFFIMYHYKLMHEDLSKKSCSKKECATLIFLNAWETWWRKHTRLLKNSIPWAWVMDSGVRVEKEV